MGDTPSPQLNDGARLLTEVIRLPKTFRKGVLDGLYVIEPPSPGHSLVLGVAR